MQGLAEGTDLSRFSSAFGFLHIEPVVRPVMRGGTIVLILGTVLGAAFLAGIYPAAKAAHRPGPRRAEALRGLFPRPP